MRQMTFEESKKVELDILKEVAAFCDRKGLRYFLAYGTLLGAVRHKGFIPWDDDVDIFMPREDYNALIESFNKESEGRYRLIAPFDPIARHSFAKVMDTKTVKVENRVDYSKGNLGVDLDVFPLDGQPEDEGEYRKWYQELQRIYEAHSFFVLQSPKTFKGKVRCYITKLLYRSKENTLKKAEKLHALYPYDKCDMIGSVDSRYNPIKTRYPKAWFSAAVSGEYEDGSFALPIEYDKVLTATYGDYMTPPPKEKQVPPHTNRSYFLDD